MTLLRFAGCALSLWSLQSIAWAENAPVPTAANLAADLKQISLNPKQTYRVRDLEFARGDIKLYLNDGVLSFFTPVDHRLIGAVFTTEGAEAGDAEVIVLPPQKSERASLASFAKTPNLDEHFATALFFFTDDTAQILLDKVARGAPAEPAALPRAFVDHIQPVSREIAEQIEVHLLQALLDKHSPGDGIFYSVVAGKSLGVFDLTYDPMQSESVFVGRVSDSPEKDFQLWANFRPRHAPPFVQPEPDTSDYRIDATVRPDLRVDFAANFRITTSPEDGRVLALSLSPRLNVSSALVDGKPAEIFQHPSKRSAEFGSTEPFLLVSPTVLVPGLEHQVQLRYSGSIIRQTANGEYFVDERSTWYPIDGPVVANFDLTFHCPARLRLVSTGEPVSETIEDGVRTVHRKTIVPAVLAGFNLGQYATRQIGDKPYSIEIDSPQTSASSFSEDSTLGVDTAAILNAYTSRWIPLRIHSLAVTPIAGYFGQGFPGLIYLSSVSYIKQENRSAALRNARFDAFFSELLLPHEIAHQWWGNIVRQADYRSQWITEAMANHAALGYVERTKGRAARDEILASYRQDLTQERDGKTVECAGPVSFGQRLIDNFGITTWQIILYEKGSWILRMLNERLGEANFRNMQLRLLHDYAGRPLSNEEFRQVASRFVPAGEPDPSLSDFFDTWVYATGIPGLALHGSGRSVNLQVSKVDEDFVAEIPLHCKGATAYWVKASSGDNVFELPKGVSGCELPSLHDYLYTLSEKR